MPAASCGPVKNPLNEPLAGSEKPACVSVNVPFKLPENRLVPPVIVPLPAPDQVEFAKLALAEQDKDRVQVQLALFTRDVWPTPNEPASSAL